jgi:hypothetical protein
MTAKPIARLAKALTPKKGITPVVPNPQSEFALATVQAINGDGTIDVSFDGTAQNNVTIQALGHFTPIVQQVVMTVVFGTAIYAIGPTSSERSVARAGCAAGGSAAAGAWTIVPLDTISLDPDGTFSSRPYYTVQDSGYYQVSGCICVELENNPQEFIAGIYLDSVAAVVASGDQLVIRGGTAGDVFAISISDILFATGGDSFGLAIFNNGGNACPIIGDASHTYLSVAPV